MTKTYRFGPWIASATLCALAFVGLLVVQGDDPISTGLIYLGLWIVGAVGAISLIGLAVELAHYRRLIKRVTTEE